MKKLVFIANIRLPTEKAHGIQIMKMCEAYAELGREVTLVVPRRRNAIKSDPYEFYTVKKTFIIEYLRSPDLMHFGPIGFLLTTWIFGLIATRAVLNKKFDMIYSRDGIVLWLLSWFEGRFIYESHGEVGGDKWWVRRVLRKCYGFVTMNKAIQDMHKSFVNGEMRLLIAPSGVSLDEFAVDKDRQAMRREPGFNDERKSLVYAGHLYKYKGVDTLAGAARLLPEHDFYFVGGTDGDIEKFRSENSNISNIKIIGHRPHKDIPLYLMSADALVIPNSAMDPISKLYTSPIKLFEYMASGTPIIASDLPSIREVLNESTGYFFKADDAGSLVEAVRSVFGSTESACARAQAAKIEANKYSYIERAKKILDFAKL